MKNVLLIRLGRFGRHLAMQLSELGHQVMAVDRDEERINECMPFVTNAQIGDSTRMDFLRSLGVGNYDVCYVTISGDFQNSLETTSLLKELGAKYAVSRTERDVQAKFLLRNGADAVTYPEKQLAKWAAIRYTANHIFSYIELGEKHAIIEIAVPGSWQGHSISELDIRRKYGVNIPGVKRNDKTDVNISPETVLDSSLTLLVLGQPLPMCLALGAIAAATAPEATLMVVRQYKANGPVTRMLLPVVAMDDALGLMLYAIMMAIARTLDSGAALSVMTLLVKPLIEIVGSLVMGVLIGTVMVFCLRFFHSRGNKLTMTILVVFLAVGLSTMLDLSSLLVCMMIGATMINVSNDSSALLEQCDRFTPPLFLLFFVLSGASLDLSVLPTVGVVGIAYVLSRAIGKSLGATIGAAIEKCDKNIIRYLGMTLIPQAGVAIGMARMCLTDLPAYGPTINAVVLAGTLIYELTGPVITKIALTKAGEIKEGGAKPAAVTAAK